MTKTKEMNVTVNGEEKKDVMTNVKALNYVLENCELPADVKAKIAKMAEQQAKKSTSRKPAAEKEENIALMVEIDNVLEVATAPMNATEIFIASPVLQGLSNQKVSSLLGVMEKAGKVVRTINGGRSYFSKVR